MLPFRTPRLSDKPLFEAAAKNAMGDEAAFFNTFIFGRRYDTEICFYDGFILLTYWSAGEQCGYNFPIGDGDPTRAVAAIFEDAAERGRTANLWLMNPKQAEWLMRNYPGRFFCEPSREDYDYIYRREDLATLAGRAYQSKRNHISKFCRAYPDWRFEPLSLQNFSHAVTVSQQWCAELDSVNEDLQEELQALETVGQNYDALGVSGGVLYVGEKPVAMTIATMIRPDVCDVHYEKALGEYAVNGAYALINREFARTLSCTWINREEDVGNEGLRKAKLSYHPAVLLEKIHAEPLDPNLQLRRAEQQDIPALRDLWQQCFDDDDAHTDLFFAQRFCPERAYVAVSNGTVCAFLNLLPCRLSQQQGHYLYAACTHPRFRSRGVMRTLISYALQQAQQQGDCFSLLLPASDSLYEFYAARGYQMLYGTVHCTVTKQQLEALVPTVAESRHRAIAAVEWDDAALSYAKQMAMLDGALLQQGESILAVTAQKNTVSAEFLQYCPQDETDLLSRLPVEHPAAQYTLRLPVHSPLAQTVLTPAEPFGMLRPLSPEFSVPAQAYLTAPLD